MWMILSYYVMFEEGQLKTLRVILVLFEGISGLHINWRNSFLLMKCKTWRF